MSKYVENPLLANNTKDCWMRKIQVILTSKIIESGNNNLIFGNEEKHNFNIEITGEKHLALLKDAGVVAIHNLEYDTIAKILLQEYFLIEIKIGYKSNGSLFTIFKGEVSYISQKTHSKHDTVTYITYASRLVASYSQKRMNFAFNSGINLWGVLNYIFQLNGNDKIYMSDSLKKAVLKEAYSSNSTVTTAIDSLLYSNAPGNIVMTDESFTNNLISCTDLNNKRIIKVDANTINITKGNPTVTSDGLKVTLLPTMNFSPGDILEFQNELIDVHIADPNAVKSTFNPNFIDRSGHYIIMDIKYNLQNRGKSFEFEIKARSLDVFRSLISTGGPI